MRHARLNLFPDSLVNGFVGPARNHGVPRSAPELAAEIAALEPTVERVTLAGGSPLAHPGFWELLDSPRLSGVTKGLETDAASLAADNALERLRGAGVSELFVVVAGERLHRRMLPGTVGDARQGLERALRSELSTYVVPVAMRFGVGDVLPLVEALCSREARPQGVLLALPRPRSVDRGAWRQLLPPTAAAELAARVFERCHRAGVEYGFFDWRGVSPCLAGGVLDCFGTVFHERFAFRAHEVGDAERVAACSECSLGSACNGLEPDTVDAFGARSALPIPLATSMDWKLRPIHSLDRVDYKNVSPFETPGSRPPRVLLRVNGHCNMSCSFCFVDRTVPDFEAQDLKRDIDRMRSSGGRHLVLSGGEPTLHPELPELLGHGRQLGFETIEIQTNGVRAADVAYAAELVAAGLGRATISLHSVSAVESDRVTRLPGGFDKTLQAIDNFRALGISTQIAHVITKANYRELPHTVRWLRERFPSSGGHLSLCLAIAQGISDLVFTGVVPTFTEIEPWVREALDYCLEHDVGFGGMIGQGGYPPCMLGGQLRYYENVLDQVFVSEDSSEQFYKAERCRECSFEPYCVGVRRAYVDTYGDDELRPFTADVSQHASLRPLPGEVNLVRPRAKRIVT